MIRVIPDTHWIGRKGLARHIRVSLLDGAAIDLEFHSIAVGILVVERESRPVVHRPIGADASLLQAIVSEEKVADTSVCKADVIYAYLAAIIRPNSHGSQNIQIRESKAMMLVVIGQERERWITVDHGSFEDTSVPMDHLVETPRHVDDMRELDRFRHVVLRQGFPGCRCYSRNALTV